MEPQILPHNQQIQIDQLQQETRGIVPFVPQGLAWKLTSPDSEDPGHIHTSSSLDLSAILESGSSLSRLNNIPYLFRVTSHFEKTNSTAKSTVTGLSKTLISGNSYTFKFYGWLEAGAVGGIKIGMGGTAGFSDVMWHIRVLDDAGTNRIESLAANLTSDFTRAGETTYYCEIWGSIVCNSAGTLVVEFAQSVSNGTASRVVKGSFFEVTKI